MSINYDVDFERIAIGNFVLIVLNESLNLKKSNNPFFKQIWKNADKRVLVDGASNWFFEKYEEFGDPNYICGDMDSISKQALEFFEKKITSSKIVTLSNQDETDFEKTLAFCIDKLCGETVEYIVVIWAQSGRIDHNLSCISTLIKYNNKNSLPIYLIDIDCSLSCVLRGVRKIKVNIESTWCSIVPIGEPTKVTTTGFKWNLADQELKFGQLISTSNEFDRTFECCTIRCDKPLFFSMDFSAK